MYHIRELNINNTLHGLLWLEKDTQCWDLILNDWRVMNEVIAGLIQGNDLVVQAGGNCGLYPLLYSQYFKHVVTFEMDSDCFTALCYNNNKPSITRVNTALGNMPQFINYGNIKDDNVGMHSLLTPNTDLSKYTQMLTLDNFDLPCCNLIHLDIEGSEWYALQGAKATIYKHRPLIVLEMTHYIEEIQRFMKDVVYVELFVFDPKQVSPVNIIYGPKERMLDF